MEVQDLDEGREQAGRITGGKCVSETKGTASAKAQG